MNDSPQYDVVIVGAGFCGAILAKQLAAQKKRVLVLEAGMMTPPTSEAYQAFLFHFYQSVFKVPNAPYPRIPNALQPDAMDLAPISPGHPDTNGYYVQMGPQPFGSDYVRRMGGTSLHWLGVCFRMLPNDFRLRSRYGRGVDWPMSYDDLMPWYNEAEFELGVSAEASEQAYLGIIFDDGYVYPMHKIPQTYLDQKFLQGLEGMTFTSEGKTYPVRIVSTPVARNSTPNPKFHRNGHTYKPLGAVGNPFTGERCEGNASCIPICPVQAKYNALKTLYSADLNYVQLQSQSVAYGLEIDSASGRIQGVKYKRYTNPTSPEHTDAVARGSVYVLAGDAIENAKLLLASGACNSSDEVGRNLMDHPYFLTWGNLPYPTGPWRSPAFTSGVESLRDGDFRANRAAFRMEIVNWGWDFAGNSPYSVVQSMVNTQGLFGKTLRKALWHSIQGQFRTGFMLEQLPSGRNRVSVDPQYRDQLGIYRPVLNYQFDDYLLKGLESAKMFSDLVMARMNAADNTAVNPGSPGYIEYNGAGYNFYGSGHLVGTHRMGWSRYDSVVDRNQKTWDHENLYLVGCGNMPTVATSNPSLTMAALAFWASSNILSDLAS
jgi:choline dehydrogenase-like flavoprotein